MSVCNEFTFWKQLSWDGMMSACVKSSNFCPVGARERSFLILKVFSLFSCSDKLQLSWTLSLPGSSHGGRLMHMIELTDIKTVPTVIHSHTHHAHTCFVLTWERSCISGNAFYHGALLLHIPCTLILMTAQYRLKSQSRGRLPLSSPTAVEYPQWLHHVPPESFVRTGEVRPTWKKTLIIDGLRWAVSTVFLWRQWVFLKETVWFG